MHIATLKTLRLCLIPFTAITITPIAFLAGCGAGTTPSIAAKGTNISVLAASTLNDAVSSYTIGINNLTLISSSGAKVTLISAPVRAEFTHLNGTGEPITTVQVPPGTYTSADISVGDYSTLCVRLSDAGGLQGNGILGVGQPANVSINLPQPVTVTADSMDITLDLSLNGTCESQAARQAFALVAGNNVAQPIDSSPGKLTALQGVIKSLSTSGTSFTVTSLEGLDDQAGVSPAWTVAADSSTAFQGVSGPSGLLKGMPVEMDATVQADGSLLASRIAVYDTQTDNLTLWSGPLMSVDKAGQTVTALGRISAGPIGGGQMTPLDASQAKFQISGQFSNLSSLPFSPSFNASNMVPGQTVDLTFHQASYPSGNNLPAISTLTLVPQTMNGTITATGTSGGFTTYTVWLATNDLFPSLSFQYGGNNLLSTPRVVVVYVDANTQTLNGQPLAVGNLLRFNGLVFNDHGVLRMDCGQVKDGVAE